MRRITNIEELRNIMLTMACEVKKICEENNLRYYLAAGTLLGAVRHKGFIPWDDDIDLYMPRPDYDKFIEIYYKAGGQNILHVQEINPKYLYSYIKISAKDTVLHEKEAQCGVELGVNIDIFPLDGLGNTKKDAHKIFRKINLPIKLLMSYRVNKIRKDVSFFKNCLVIGANMVARLFGPEKLSKKITKSAKIFNYDKSKLVGSFMEAVGDNRIFSKELFKEECFLEFEGVQFAVPSGYKDILSAFYGDYMKLPPKEQQVFTHGYEAFIEE